MNNGTRKGFAALTPENTERVEPIAEQERRSFNQMVNLIVEEWLNARHGDTSNGASVADSDPSCSCSQAPERKAS